MEISDEAIARFRRKVWAFYRTHRRRLPWRSTHDPYKVLVSELMLQQTQVSRVIGYYTQWMQQWPTIQDLAQASRHEVLHAWIGLGYNARALRLLQAAKTIVNEYHGNVVRAMEQYEKIPGVGRYTSQAVLIFATNANRVTVDTNIRRIFIHEFHLPETLPDNNLWDLAQRCLPKGRSRDWHNALMDYGALHHTAKKTGIKPRTRQSRFQGSDRQLRGLIMRRLLNGAATVRELSALSQVAPARLERILQKMVEERLVVCRSSRYTIDD